MNRVKHIVNHFEDNNTISTNQCSSANDSTNKVPEQYGGQLVAHVLLEEGVSHVFTLTGGHISPILVGCNQSGVKVIDVRDEVTTVFAADASARITGIPGVAIVTAGPGLTNTITAVKNAQMAESPVIVMGGATTQLLKGRGSLQDIDQIALMAPHVKWHTSIKKVSDIIPSIRKAFIISKSGVPGPVFIEFPLETIWPKPSIDAMVSNSNDKTKNKNDDYAFLTNFNPAAYITELYIKYHLNKVFRNGFTAHLKDSKNIRADGFSTTSSKLELQSKLNARKRYTTYNEYNLNQCVINLMKTRRPLLIIGSQSVLHPTLISDLIQAVQFLQMPTYLSGMARGLLGQQHPLYFRHKRSFALKKCDFVILCGVSCDFRLDYGRGINKNAYFVHVNLDKKKLSNNNDIRKRQLIFNSDPQTFLLRLAELIKRQNIDLSKTNQLLNRDLWFSTLEQSENKREMQIELLCKNNKRLNQNQRFIHPLRFCRALNKIISDDCYLIADGGDFVGTASYTVKPRYPLRWLDPGAFGTLGCGAGFALGVSAVTSGTENRSGDREIWILYGDGSFGWSIAEFDTFCRHKYPVIAVIGNDACWSQMWRDQVRIMKDDVATVLQYTDYHRVVEGFGCKGILIDRECDMVEKLKLAKQYAKQGHSVVVNVLLTKSTFREGSMSL